MAKNRRPPETAAPPPNPLAGKTQVAGTEPGTEPGTESTHSFGDSCPGGHGASELIDALPERSGDEPEDTPELWGYGVSPGAGGWLAFKISTHGQVEILNPRRHGAIAGEQKHSALARMQDAIKLAYLGPAKKAVAR